MFGISWQHVIAQTSSAALGDGATSMTSGEMQTGLLNIGIMVVAIIVPFVLGKFFSNRLRMPTHSMAFSWILLAVIATSLVIGLGYVDVDSSDKVSNLGPKLKFGPDIIGGTNLIYEIDRSNTAPNQARVTAKDFMVPLVNRLNPSGTKEIVIRPIGDDQIEIIVPDQDPADIADLKKKITSAGILQFRIVANKNDHTDIIQKAIAQSESPDQNTRLSRDVILVDKNTNEQRVAGIWRSLGRGLEVNGVKQINGYYSGDLIRDARTGKILNPVLTGKENDFENWLQSQNIVSVDILLALEKRGTKYTEVNGADLQRAQKTFGKNGGYEVTFTMTSAGAVKMLGLTGANQPDVTSDFKRRMAILLDNQVLSAPNLNSPIRGEGVIQGNFSEKDVDFNVQILNSGSLPGAISKEPISQSVIGASMGKDAIAKGGYASAVSLLVTIVCVLAYYRFAGIIATIALLLNLAMIIACMILIKQPLTLAGIAGLVLSVGMSVDANVLVFERMREETEKKATPRMAIRNGFDRAWTTIFDSNLTTLITAVVLYWVGTEQVKGFAITLIIGLVISMFTAVYFTHKLFEIADRWGFAYLNMSDYVNNAKRSLFGPKDINFLGARNICFAVSATLIVVGLVATGIRGTQILDIDFNGGTSVVFSLDKSLPADEVRQTIAKIFDVDADGLPIQTTITNVEVREFAADTVYKLDVSLKDDQEVRNRLLKGFSESSGPRLVTFDLETKILSNAQSSIPSMSGVGRLVSFQDPAPAADAGQAPATPAPTTEPAQPPVAEATTVDPAIAGTAEPPATTTPAPTAAATPEATATPVVPTEVTTSVRLAFTSSNGGAAKQNAAQLSEVLIASAKTVGRTLVDAQIEMQPVDTVEWTRESGVGFSAWNVKLPFDTKDTQLITDQLRQDLRNQPVFQSVSKIQSRVASEMQQRAIAGLLLSFVFIMAYIWFRFQKLAYGIAAVIALVHDVMIALAFIAVSHWLFQPLGFLLIEDFKISLTIVAAFLTIIGYSLNDTIVVFDRIREVKGKSPNLTEAMINASVTQTLSRTLLTSSTTIVAILLMYIFGGEGIHGFAFCLFIGIIVGTYSSIYIAAPVLLWFVRREQAAKLASKVS